MNYITVFVLWYLVYLLASGATVPLWLQVGIVAFLLVATIRAGVRLYQDRKG